MLSTVHRAVLWPFFFSQMSPSSQNAGQHIRCKYTKSGRFAVRKNETAQFGTVWFKCILNVFVFALINHAFSSFPFSKYVCSDLVAAFLNTSPCCSALLKKLRLRLQIQKNIYKLLNNYHTVHNPSMLRWCTVQYSILKCLCMIVCLKFSYCGLFWFPLWNNDSDLTPWDI